MKPNIGGEKSGKRGRGAVGKAMVVVAAEIDGKRIGRIRLRRVPDASAETLEVSIWPGDNRLPDMFGQAGTPQGLV